MLRNLFPKIHAAMLQAGVEYRPSPQVEQNRNQFLTQQHGWMDAELITSDTDIATRHFCASQV